MTRWTAADIPSMDGKVAVVTGGNSGLGFESAKALAAAKAHVVLACRSEESANGAIARIKADDTAATLSFLPLDLASQSSIKAFAAAFRSAHARLDLLLNNAGVMALPYKKTTDGFESQLGTNHLGHFALTGLLLGRLIETEESRVVTVSSLMHHAGWMRWDDMQWERRYSKWLAYGQSKLANLLFAYELDRRLSAHHFKVKSLAAHPGYSATNLQGRAATITGSSFGKLVWKLWNAVGAQPASMGALPSLYAATAPDANGGDFIGPGGLFEVRGYPVKVSSNARSRDRKLAARLWEASEALTGVRYEELVPP
jgi:NAD(P)-dependent dehydrogenase (short-subunit alcohol dehydrogenase family)